MAEDGHHEIVIIRRGGHGDHDEHHGGVWKIAFADFMTAMMAFFLVMWLISANDKTRASVARYFNPVRLVDATTQPRGLHDPKKDESGISATANTKENAPKPDKAKNTDLGATAPVKETPAGREKRLDNALREDPYAALAEIAAKGPGDVVVPPKTPGAAVIGRRGGDAFRDPFAPPPEAAEAPAEPQPSPREEPEKGAAAPPAAVAKTERQQADTKAQILASLKAAGAEADGPGVEVRRTGEGLLVSLTDTTDFSMFSNGSAVPSRRVVQMMARVADVLKGKPGTIVVRGYTDSKPFHSARYDNWRLSLERAQVTHYMLVRGGLADARIGHIEGYADRGARPGIDPSSPVNRRIDILLKDQA